MDYNNLPEEKLSEDKKLIQTETVQGGNDDGTLLNLDQKERERKKKIKYAIFGALALIAITLAIVLPIVLRKKPVPPGPGPTPKPPIDYYNPYVLDPKSVVNLPSRTTGLIRAAGNYSSDGHSIAFKRLFSKLKDDHPLKKGVNTTGIPLGVNNHMIKTLNFTFTQNTWRVSKMIITDADNKRYSIPEAALGNPGENLDMRLDLVGFNLTTNGTFEFSFSDPLIAGNTFINTSNCSLVFMDKFIQMDFQLPSQNIFGFGERIHEFGLKEGAWNMWAHGQPNPYDDGTGRKGGYGVHPFILIQGKRKDDFFGMYFRNSNAMTPIITFNDDGTSKLSYITIGGQLEVYFFLHGSALDIIKKYQDVMGAKPKLPPFWALGWMQASYKWPDQETVETVVKKYKENNLPLDTIFLDIPYMANYTDFTVNKSAFPNLTVFINELHQNKQQIIPIIDAGISAVDLENKYYKMGNEDDIFIKSGLYKSKKYNNNLINQVWPDIAVFVDWFNPNSTRMWWEGLRDLYNDLPYDGIWIDMNEPWGFQTAELNPDHPTPIPINSTMSTRKPSLQAPPQNNTKNYTWYKSFPQNQSSTWYLPFLPDFENYQSYDNNTMSLNATNPSINETQYNVHSFYGHMMAKRTSQYFQNRSGNASDAMYDKRHFILTRSTYTSSGQYASHWLGDNYREYAYMNYSISGIMNMNMFGIPHVGADICGFFGKFRDDIMCSLWAQLGTFYPFARFHYDIHSPANEPYLMNEPYLSITRRTMLDRYQYLRQLYTCLRDMSTNGGSCFDPLFYHFPTDDKLYSEIESSFLFAGVVKVTPKLQYSQDQFVDSYFPAVNGKWVSLTNTRDILDGGKVNRLDTTGGSTNAHMMPGKVMAFQNNSDGKIMNIHQLINATVTILVNPDNNDFAQGSLFLDQGESQSELDNQTYEYYNFQFSAKSLQFFQEGNAFTQTGYSLESVKILNGQKYKDNDVVCYLSNTKNLEPQPLVARFVEEENVLRLFSETDDLKFSDIHSIHFSRSTEFNICDRKQYQYKIDGGVTPDIIGKSQVDIKLVHIAGVLTPITVRISSYQGGVINIKWTYTDGQGGKKMYKVPDEYVNANQLKLSGDLNELVEILPAPFQIKFLFADAQQTEFFGIDGMVYDDYLNWLRVHVVTPTRNDFRGIFGLGERATTDFFYKDGVYSMWSRDVPTPIETKHLPASNMYGTHPFFMYKHRTSAWVGVLYNLAAAQDWWIQNDQNKGLVNIQTVAVGGVVDIYIMMGKTPDDVVSKYFTIIGNPVHVPQWGLGWNQCRYGYRSTDVLKSVLKGYRDNNIPLDVMWSDIDYMKDYRNFIYDSDGAFVGLKDFVDSLHSQGMRYVPILDAGTAARPLPADNYQAFITGQQQGVFLKINGETFIGQVWPNDAAFPDFFSTNAQQWWQDNLSSMHKLLPFDGLWLDMNEVSNFCGGVCYQRQAPASSVKSQLKYTPTGRDLEKPNALPLDTKHASGDMQIDTHSLYGISEIKVTHDWFQQVQQQRTFIIERSSYAGMGKWASRWLGDNFSYQIYMKLSVSGIMLMNMFGIPLAGSDICGFLDNTWQDLCVKWHFVGAFYPFSRNHNGGQVPQEPYVFNKTAMDEMRTAIKLKYSLIRYYYTLLTDNSLRGTGTIYKPVFFEFPEDKSAYSDIEYNIMIGSGLKVSINSYDLNSTYTPFYFPAGTWCLLGGKANTTNNCFNSTSGVTLTLPSTLSDYQMHIREGYIIPMQDTLSASAKNFTTSKDLQNWEVDFHLLGSVTTNNQWYASGRYINDDGTVLNMQGNYNSYTLYASYDGVQNVTVRFGMDAKATNYLKPNGCYQVNQNDIMGTLAMYNAANLFGDVSGSWSVQMTLLNGSVVAADAQYDSSKDAITIDARKEQLCLSNISKIVVSKL